MRISQVFHSLLRCLPFAALLFTALSANAAGTPPTPVEKVRAYREGNGFFAELHFQGEQKWNGAGVDTRFFSDYVQVDIPGAFLAKGKQLIKVDDRIFKSVYATQADASTLRLKFETKDGANGKGMAADFQVRKASNGLSFTLSGDGVVAKGAKAVGDEAMTFAVIEDEAMGGDALPARLVAGAAKSESAEAQPVEAKAADEATALPVPEKTAKLPEHQIPVLTNTKAKKSQESNFGRLMITLGVLAILLGATLFGLKRWSARGTKQAQTTRIKVLTQHHLGPKKSVAIIQVAGESILVGITDHNISMLKTLSLIDDEVPAEVPNRFDNTLDSMVDEGAEYEEAPSRRNQAYEAAPRRSNRRAEAGDEFEGEDFAMRGLSDIRDTVSKRLKNMRNL